MDAGEPTLLHLQATGTVREVPDLLTAELIGEATSTDPATAQARTDRLMQRARQLATAAGVPFALADYAVDRENNQNGTTPAAPPGWTARQTLRLEGGDAARLLALAGRLQGEGMALASLAWTVSPPRLAAAQAQAIDLALAALRTRAEAAARALGLRMTGFRDVTLDAETPFRPRPMMMSMRAMPAVPQATQDAQDVSHTAEGTALLRPLTP